MTTARRPDADHGVRLLRFIESRGLRRSVDAAGAGLTSLALSGLPLSAFGAVPAWYAVLVPALWVPAVHCRGGYRRAELVAVSVDHHRCIAGAALLLLATISLSDLLMGASLSRAFTFAILPATALVSLGLRLALQRWAGRLRRRGRAQRRVLIIGREDAADELITAMGLEPRHGLQPVGRWGPATDPAAGQVPYFSGDVLSAVEATKADVVAIVSHPDQSGNVLRRLSWSLHERGIDLIVSPGIADVAGARIQGRIVSGMLMLRIGRPGGASGGGLVVKGVVDRMAASLALVTLSPLMLVIAAAVRLTSRGPILQREIRVGCDGYVFRMFSFRSVVQSPGQEPRVTRVGAGLRWFSLVNLPQLINVVRGDMSLVGPRAPRPEEVAAYGDQETRRLLVKPGMTGLWQVSGGERLTPYEGLRLDLHYTDNWSLGLDLVILLRAARGAIGDLFRRDQIDGRQLARADESLTTEGRIGAGGRPEALPAGTPSGATLRVNRWTRRFLSPEAAELYAEELMDELFDLAEQGQPRRRQLICALRQLGRVHLLRATARASRFAGVSASNRGDV